MILAALAALLTLEKTIMPKIESIHIAKSSCYPPYGIVVYYADGSELWDCDCAGSTEADVLAKAKQAYPRRKVLMWDNPLHYSNKA